MGFDESKFRILNQYDLLRYYYFLCCGGRGSGAAVQALTADENVELVAMADAFADRIEKSLIGIKKHFDGEEKLDYSTSKHQGNKRKISVKEKNKFVGFDAYKKAIDLADVVILTTPPGFRPDKYLRKTDFMSLQ